MHCHRNSRNSEHYVEGGSAAGADEAVAVELEQTARRLDLGEGFREAEPGAKYIRTEADQARVRLSNAILQGRAD